MYYQIINVGKESIGIVWQHKGSKPQIERIFLPCSKTELLAKIKKKFPEVNEEDHKAQNKIETQITEFYSGKKIKFDLSFLNFKKLSGFLAKVLKNNCKIPYGKVVTYSGLAAKIGSPRAARAVGTALANNPFPILIPCHRVVRADGSLGGFGGGSSMKRELLDKEGVAFDSSGRVSAKCIWQ